MNRRPTLDPSSFERLLFAAWVLQCQQEQEVRNRRAEALLASANHLAAERLVAAKPNAEKSSESKILEPSNAVPQKPVSSPEFSRPTLSRLSFRRPSLRQQWELFAASVGPYAQLASQALSRVRARTSRTSAAAASYRPNLSAESANRYLRGTYSYWKSRLQEISRQRWPVAQQSLLNLVQRTKNGLEPLARYRVKVRIMLSPRRALAAAGIPLLVLLMLTAFTLFQISRQNHFDVVAATRPVDSAEGRINQKADLGSPAPVQVTHKRVTDRAVLSLVDGVSNHEVRALQRQARYGDDSAALVVGMLYETGRYVPQSCTKAADWVAKAANWGNPAAQYNLGLRYLDGDGLPYDEDKAEKWLRKAAHQRYAKAVTALEKLSSRDADSTYSR
jgi:TPR repeat protein